MVTTYQPHVLRTRMAAHNFISDYRGYPLFSDLNTDSLTNAFSNLTTQSQHPAIEQQRQGRFSGYPIDQTNGFPGEQLSLALLADGINLNDFPPFHDTTVNLRHSEHGVIKIQNIPFTVDAQEITQFIRKFSTVPMLKKTSQTYPIHVIMEKSTGKTMDAFVEFPSHRDASLCIRRYEDVCFPGRGMKLGTRNAELELSDQAELMEAVFPRARLVKFDPMNGAPTILDPSLDPSWSTGFRGYFTLEEIHGVTRYTELPSRSPFVLKCHQRVYECMISTLYKFPWPATKTYTIAARNVLYECVFKQLEILSKKVGCPTGPAADQSSRVQYNFTGRSYYSGNALTCDPMDVRIDTREVGLSQALLSDLLTAAVSVPIFSPLQKLGLCQACGPYGRRITLHSFSSTWPFQTLIPDPDTPDHVLKFWLELFDTGFDSMELQGLPTTFEDQIIFTRNKIGFPIAEWTPKGNDLPFEDANRVERAAMMCYITEGRALWAKTQKIDIVNWDQRTVEDLIRSMVLEKDTLKKVSTNSTDDSQTTRTPSPRTVEKAPTSNTTISPREDEIESTTSTPAFTNPRRQPINPPSQTSTPITSFYNPFVAASATRHMSTDTQVSPFGSFSGGIPTFTPRDPFTRTQSMFTTVGPSERKFSVQVDTEKDKLMQGSTTLRQFASPPRSNTIHGGFGPVGSARTSIAMPRSNSEQTGRGQDGQDMMENEMSVLLQEEEA